MPPPSPSPAVPVQAGPGGYAQQPPPAGVMNGPTAPNMGPYGGGPVSHMPGVPSPHGPMQVCCFQLTNLP